MSEEITLEDVIVAQQKWIQQTWQRIYETVVKPLCRWFQRVWASLDKEHKRIALQMGTHPRQRNSRIQMVQAKRARLMLPSSGKYAGMSRRASYALAREVMRTGVYE